MKSRLSFAVLLGVVFLFLSPFATCHPGDTLSKDYIALQVEGILRNATYCEVTATVKQIPIGEGGQIKGGTDPVVIRSVMGKNAFKSLVYKNDKLIMAFALSNGRLQEYRPRSKHRPLLQYDPPFLHGTDDTVLKEEEDCLVGSQTFSWVGVPFENEVSPPTDIAKSFSRKIMEGEQEADMVERGHDCYVFRQTIPIGDRKIENVIYVDKNSFLVVRWDTFQPGVQRIRLHDIQVCGAVPENVNWRIDVDESNNNKKQ